MKNSLIIISIFFAIVFLVGCTYSPGYQYQVIEEQSSYYPNTIGDYELDQEEVGDECDTIDNMQHGLSGGVCFEVNYLTYIDTTTGNEVDVLLASVIADNLNSVKDVFLVESTIIEYEGEELLDLEWEIGWWTSNNGYEQIQVQANPQTDEQTLLYNPVTQWFLDNYPVQSHYEERCQTMSPLYKGECEHFSLDSTTQTITVGLQNLFGNEIALIADQSNAGNDYLMCTGGVTFLDSTSGTLPMNSENHALVTDGQSFQAIFSGCDFIGAGGNPGEEYRIDPLIVYYDTRSGPSFTHPSGTEIFGTLT
jgi:hypothetical protein